MSAAVATVKIQSAQVDICHADAALVAAQGLGRQDALQLRKTALDHLRLAADAVERAQRELENTLYENG